MANCKNCGSALPPNSTVCSYCNTRNEVDLSAIHRYTVENPESERICPRCNKPLQTINLNLAGKYLIENCVHCMGLFFDPGELEALLDKTVTNVYEIDRQRLDEIQKVGRKEEYAVTYIKCPVCQKLMNRINFGSQSGVIVDKCRDHGVWLDGGELRQILEWVKAGGDLYHKQKQLELERIEIQNEKEKIRFQALDAATIHANHGFSDPLSQEWDLFHLIGRVLKKLTRSHPS